MNQHFPKPYEPFSGDINVKVDFNYVKISCLVMQQKQLSKTFRILILEVLH